MRDILVCFALAEEARPFERRVRGHGGVGVLVTGIGRRNAEASVRRALSERRPVLVLTCGFAGGLDPALGHGAVIVETDAATDAMPVGRAMVERLAAAGAKRGRVHCADRIAVTAAEKRTLRRATGAEAVELESGAIRAVCHAAGVPCVTVRVISDVADEDLPLDFNALLKADQVLDVGRLLWKVVRSPRLVGRLWRLQRRSREAADRLAGVLESSLDLGVGRRPR